MSVRKLNVSNVEYYTNYTFPYGTLWFDSNNRLRVSDGVSNNGKVLFDPANLTSPGVIGGGQITFDTSRVGAPGVDSNGANDRIMLYDAGDNTYGIGIENNHIWINTGNGGNGVKFYNSGVQAYSFENTGLTFPDGTTQTTAFTGTFIDVDTLDSVVLRGSVTGNSITVGGLYSNTLESNTTPQVGNQVANVPHWETAGANTYGWFDTTAPQFTALNGYGDITGWTVSVSDGNSAIVTALNPLGYYSIGTDQPLTGSGTVTFSSPNFSPTVFNNLILTSNGNNIVLSNTGTVTVPNSIISQSYELGLAGSQYSYSIGRYLRIRDGDISSHLHLDSGDNTAYDIILGDDSKFVRVDHTGTVVIGVSNSNPSPGLEKYNWEFGTDGFLKLANRGDPAYSVIVGNSVFIGGEGDPVSPSAAHLFLPRNADATTDPAGIYNASGDIEINANNHSWIFGGDGSLKTPAAPVPTHSYGAVGDKAGMVAFDSNYIYYCKEDFVSHTSPVVVDSDQWNNIVGGISSLPFLSVARAPQIGWTLDVNFTSGPESLTITGVDSLGNNRYTIYFNNTNLNVNNGNTGIITDTDPVANIWKRVAWSNDTW